MTKEDLIKLSKKINTLSDKEKKLRDTYLRRLSLGEIEGPPTGYSSIDKQYLKWYSEKGILVEYPTNMSIYDYFNMVAPEDCCIIDYYGKKYFKKDINKKVNEYTSRFIDMGIDSSSTVSFMMLNVPEVLFAWLALSNIGATTNVIKFDETPDRIKLMNDIGNSKYMFISEVPFIIKNVIDSLKLGSNIEEIITVPVTDAMKLSSTIEMLYNSSKKEALKKENNILNSVIEECEKTIETKKEIKNLIDSNSKLISFADWKKKYKKDKTKIAKKENKRDDISIVVYTGGTTGNPKGVELTNENIIAMAHTFNYSEIDFTKGKTSLNILPPGPAYYLNATYGLMCNGVCVKLISNFTIDEYPDLIAKYKPNIFLSGPILLKLMAEKNIIEDGSFITDPISGGDKLHLSEEDSINKYLKSINSNSIVHQGYGESESTAAATYAKKSATKLGTIGIPLLNVKVAIFDYMEYEEFDKDKLEEKKYNQIGEICISGPTIMHGYRNNEEETKKVLRLHSDGNYWLHTDDLGYMDEDGRLFHCGRAKRMLTRSGNKVWLGTLEDTIKQHPSVYDCCCVRQDDIDEREVPIAYVVLNNDDNNIEVFDEIENLIKKNKPEYYVPKYFIKTDEIPLTSINNKVDFKKLESENIFDIDKYQINGKIVSTKAKTFVKKS